MNAIVWLLKIAAFMMLAGTVVVDALVLTAWFGAGIVEDSWSQFPLWIVLVAWLISFLNVLIASFLFGVSRQVATNAGADKKELPLDEKLSDTIDEGWGVSLRIVRNSSVAVLLLMVGLAATFYSDLKFLLGMHKGMEYNSTARFADAQRWFKVSMESAGPDRIAIVRFLYAGSLIREHKYPQAEAELQDVLKSLDEKNDDHLALLVYVYSAISNCYMFQNKLPEAELWTNKAIKVIEEHPQMFGLRFRMLGPYKQFLIPEPPPLSVAISGLNDIYMMQKRPDLALATYKRILDVLSKKPALSKIEIFGELDRFKNQLSRVRQDVSSQTSTAVTLSAQLAIRKCDLKDPAQFDSEFANYQQQKYLKH